MPVFERPYQSHLIRSEQCQNSVKNGQNYQDVSTFQQISAATLDVFYEIPRNIVKFREILFKIGAKNSRTGLCQIGADGIFDRVQGVFQTTFDI